MTLPISYFRFYFPEYVLKTRLPPNCTTGFLDSLSLRFCMNRRLFVYFYGTICCAAARFAVY